MAAWSRVGIFKAQAQPSCSFSLSMALRRLSSTTRHSPTSTSGFSSLLSDEESQNEHHYSRPAPSPVVDHRQGRNPHSQNPPDPIPNRPLRAQRPSSSSSFVVNSGNTQIQSPAPTRSSGRGASAPRRLPPQPSSRTGPAPINDSDDGVSSPTSRNKDDVDHGIDDSLDDDSFLDKFGLRPRGNSRPAPDTTASSTTADTEAADHQIKEATSTAKAADPPQDANQIFQKMKETGLIPNAVAMLDGLCKDGLVQDAMKLFASMRQKGTIPDVVVYTAVVDGFCKAHKPQDAIRIFHKMLSNGVTPNSFTYTLLIQGLCKCACLDDAVDFSLQMLDAGHSPNAATFVGLVDALCRERNLREAQAVVATLRQKGFHLHEKVVRDFLDKNAPFSSSTVWEAIFGQKPSHKPF